MTHMREENGNENEKSISCTFKPPQTKFYPILKPFCAAL